MGAYISFSGAMLGYPVSFGLKTIYKLNDETVKIQAPRIKLYDNNKHRLIFVRD
jgi:hypothetical protein